MDDAEVIEKDLMGAGLLQAEHQRSRGAGREGEAEEDETTVDGRMLSVQESTGRTLQPGQEESGQEAEREKAKERKRTLTTVVPYILVTEFCERLAYYGMSGSLVLLFERELNYSLSKADTQYVVWGGVAATTPLLGGYLADTHWGRYRTILVFSAIYLIGLALIVVGCIPGDFRPAIVFPAIYIIALGTGGIKPNVSTLGADQFDKDDPQDQKDKESFFNYFYWSINLGSLTSFILVAPLAQFGAPWMGVSKEWGFFFAYMIPTIAMALGIVAFVMGTPRYVVPKPSGSVLATTLAIIKEAAWTNRAADVGDDHWLSRATVARGGSYTEAQVRSVRYVTRLFPFLAALVPFWAVYSQMSTAFQNQGCQMDLAIADGIKMPISALSIFDTIAILGLIPVFDRWVYPWFKERGMPLSMLTKIMLGFGFALLAMLVAAGVEVERLNLAPSDGPYPQHKNDISACKDIYNYDPNKYSDWYAGKEDDKPQNCHQKNGCDDTYKENGNEYLNTTCIKCDDIPTVSSMSVFWQAPMFFLVGISEILASVTSLEFFYSQTPPVMRSVMQSLNLLTTALGSFVIAPLLIAVNAGGSGKEWVPDDLNEGYLWAYFLLLAGLMVLTMLYLWWIGRDYQYVRANEFEGLDDEDISFRSSSLVDPSSDLLMTPDIATKLDARRSSIGQ